MSFEMQYYVDGYDDNTNTIYEFHGRFWHGCPNCFPQRHHTRLEIGDITLFDVYEATIRNEDKLHSKGYNLVVMWQCEWEGTKKEDISIKELVDSFEVGSTS